VDNAELAARIASFDRWHYQFEFDGGITTPIFDVSHLNRHEQRYEYFFTRLLEATGGSLQGHRVLDLGCNAGYWSLKAIEAGADFVLGIDGRQMHVDQANLVFEAKGIDRARYRFEMANIFEYQPEPRFDIVLCLGLMYHIAKPVELFELMSRAGGKVIIIDTWVSAAKLSAFEVRRESLDEPRNSAEYELILIPTPQAVLDLGDQFETRTVLIPVHMTGDGVNDYLKGRRMAFLSVKTSALAAFPGAATLLERLSSTPIPEFQLGPGAQGTSGVTTRARRTAVGARLRFRNRSPLRRDESNSASKK
jgi:tRNA (mo5U34)-methyltransferase